MNGALWGGRFEGKLDPIMEKFNASINFDKRMYVEDITGSIAYAKALCKAGLLTDSECCSIVDGLVTVKNEWDEKRFVVKPTDEDIHTANERRLKEIVGDVAGKLHTGRSRNDQVSTDTRMWLRNSIDQLLKTLLEFIGVFLHRAEAEIDILMPGYTHLQRAQPVRWSHWLLSFAVMIKEDYERLKSILDRMNVCPLGSGALAGNPFPIDRNFIAEELNFSHITWNSMHAVGDRDFIAEFQFWASLTAVHLSKLAEDLMMYSTKEFGFVRLSDAYSTGSSLMPQKRNADSLELIRGKTGRIIGNEDKEGLFDTYDTIISVIQIATGTLATLTINKEACFKALSTDMLATDIAYYLVRKGVAFRDAHELAGIVVATAEQLDCDITKLPVEVLQKISPNFTNDISQLWNFENSVQQYQTEGGTSRESVCWQLENFKKWFPLAFNK